MIINFDQMLLRAKEKGNKRLSVACAEDINVLKSIKRASDEKLIQPILIGNGNKIREFAKQIEFDIRNFKVIDIIDNTKAAFEAIRLVSSNDADFVMKGLVSTSTFLKAVLDKEIGLRSGKILSHAAILSVKSYHKLILVTDGGIIEHPDISTKKQIVQNVIRLCKSLEISIPKIAALAAVETISEKQPETVDAAELSKMSERGQIAECIIDGPMAIDIALSKKSALHKNIKSEIAGDIDVLLVPTMAAGNILAKAMIYLADAKAAGIILGTSKPVVMLSRSDDSETKLRSIALGVLMS